MTHNVIIFIYVDNLFIHIVFMLFSICSNIEPIENNEVRDYQKILPLPDNY